MKKSQKSSKGLTNRVSTNGSIRADRQLTALGIGRLQISLDTRSEVEAARRNGILTSLVKEEAVEVLRALKERELSVEELATWWSQEKTVNNLRARFAKAMSENSTPVETTAHPKTAEDAYTRSLWIALRAYSADLEKSEAGYNTRKRYAVSLNSLWNVLQLANLPREAVHALAALPEEVASALTQVRRRGVRFADAYKAAFMTKAQRREQTWLSEARLGKRVLKALTEVPEALADVIATHLEYAPRHESVCNLSMLYNGKVPTTSVTEPGRKATEILEGIKRCADVLGAQSTVSCVELLERKDWEALFYVWGAGNTDWNQMRRMLSARLTCIVGEEHDRLRRRAIQVIPERNEIERNLRLTPEQYALILGVLPAYDRAVVVTVTLGGMRSSEFFRLEESQLDHNTCTVVLRGNKTTGSADNVPVDPSLWEHVVTAVPMVYGRSKLRAVLRAACEAVNLDPIRVHDLRHCAGHFAALGGAGEADIQAFLRHKSVAMTRRYLAKPVKQRVANAISAIVGGATEGDASANGYATTRAGTAELNQMTREALYELVWSTPSSHLATRLGISDKGLNMRCRKQNIPTPPRGYWLKTAEGKAAARVPLPRE